MRPTEIVLPSNRKFGFFFAVIFLASSVYFYFDVGSSVMYVLGGIGLLFLVVTLFNADMLLPLNQLWMRLGLLLSVIVSPVIMGVIFFGLFTPISLIMKLFRRDELSLRFKQKKTHWKLRDNTDGQADAFKNQF